MNSAPVPTPDRLRVWRQNLNKSRVTQEDLINSEVYKQYDVLILQEPFIDSYGNTKAMHDWRVVYPTSFLSHSHVIRSVILVRSSMDTNQWAQISIPGTGDLIQISVRLGKVMLFGLYIDGHHSDTLRLLDIYLHTHRAITNLGPSNHMLWCGDFNHHHPLWDEERNRHLFTMVALRESEVLLGIVADHGMVMALPRDIPTLEAMATKNWTQPDNAFCTEHSELLIVSCTTAPRLQGLGTDHVPILIILELPVKSAPVTPTRNFRTVNWEEFREELATTLGGLLAPHTLPDKQSMLASVAGLTVAIQDTIHKKVPTSHLSPHTKRWWNKELSALKKKKNQLGNTSYKFRTVPDHPIHEEHHKIRNQYRNEIQAAKKAHWAEFLEHMTNRDIWTANQYISGDASDGGKTRIPTLTLSSPPGSGVPDEEAATNEDKSAMLAKLMFPAHPSVCLIPNNFPYPPQLRTPARISAEQVWCHIEGLSPHKAPGPDGIPNAVLKFCADIVTPYLVLIYRAIL